MAGLELLDDFFSVEADFESDFSEELDFSPEPDFSLDPELDPESLEPESPDDPLVELAAFLSDSRLSVR